MADHYESRCQYGTRHGGCRCASPNKAVRRIECPTPAGCRPQLTPSPLDHTAAAIAHAVAEGYQVTVRQHTLPPGGPDALNVELAYGTEHPRPTIRRVVHAADLRHHLFPDLLALVITELHGDLAEAVRDA